MILNLAIERVTNHKISNFTGSMKQLLFILVALFSLSFTLRDITDDIHHALKQGDAAELGKRFADKISIKVLSQEDLLSKSQAQALVEDFFNKHKVKSYQIAHHSVVNGDQQFMTGSLVDTANGKYRISVLVRGNLISQFRIENDNE